MNSKTKEANLEKFKKDAESRILLISLKCGSVGLNLIVANHVILSDLWWNPSSEGRKKINLQIKRLTECIALDK